MTVATGAFELAPWTVREREIHADQRGLVKVALVHRAALEAARTQLAPHERRIEQLNLGPEGALGQV